MKAVDVERNPTRDRLIEAAGEVFADQGFHAATVRQITQRAGVNVAAVNYHFRDKKELYEAVLLHAQSCSAAPPIPDDVSAEERIRAFVHSLLTKFLDPLRPAWHGKLMARELASPTASFSRLIEEGFAPRCRLLDTALSELAGQAVPPRTRQRIAASVIGQCMFYRQNRRVTQALFPEALAGENPIDELADHITAFSLAGIRELLNAESPAR